jgi:hypothetical protein
MDELEADPCPTSNVDAPSRIVKHGGHGQGPQGPMPFKKPPMKLSWALVVVAAVESSGCDGSETCWPKDYASQRADVGSGVMTVERTYARPANELADAVATSLNSDDLGLQSDVYDVLSGEVTARGAEGHRVVARIVPVDRERSRMLINVAAEERKLAALIHERIAETLSAFPAR